MAKAPHVGWKRSGHGREVGSRADYIMGFLHLTGFSVPVYHSIILERSVRLFWGASSTDVTCAVWLCLRKAKDPIKSVPAHSGGVFAFF
jgi:hypothetical protein